jgi:predicted secreted protein
MSERRIGKRRVMNPALLEAGGHKPSEAGIARKLNRLPSDFVADIPNHLELAVGEQWAVELPGLGTSGYVWDHEVVGGRDVVEVQWSRGYPPGSPSRPAGVSAPEVATIRAVRPGTVEVRMYQHRRWEPPNRARAQHRLSVHVRQNSSADQA